MVLESLGKPPSGGLTNLVGSQMGGKGGNRENVNPGQYEGRNINCARRINSEQIFTASIPLCSVLIACICSVRHHKLKYNLVPVIRLFVSRLGDATR